jgi:uncharacterized protein (TIGR02271 family)
MNIADSDAAGTEKLPVAEEQAHLQKRRVVTGRVRVHTEVDVLDQAVRGELTAEDVSVRRVPINRYVEETAPGIRTEGELTIIPVLEEVLVVQTKLVLKEEIHIQRTRTTKNVTESVPVRKQRAVIETDGAGE